MIIEKPRATVCVNKKSHHCFAKKITFELHHKDTKHFEKCVSEKGNGDEGN